MRRLLFLLIPIFAAVALARWATRADVPIDGGSPQVPEDDREAPAEIVLAETTAAAPRSPRRLVAVGNEPMEAPVSTAPLAQYASTLDTNIFVEEWHLERYRSVFDGAPEDYEHKRAAAEAGDADAAFDIYMLVYRCRNGPRTRWQLQQSVGRVESRLLALPEGSADDAEKLLADIDAVNLAYAFCAVFDGADIDLNAEALRWLDRAADLGHMGAQRLYHAHARRLIAGQRDAPLVFQQPGLIDAFKARSDQYVRRLLDAGHPQGLSLMSRMLMTGDVYERDPLLAWAYARALERVGEDRLVAEAQGRMSWLIRDVPPADQREAELIADEIVDEWRERKRRR